MRRLALAAAFFSAVLAPNARAQSRYEMYGDPVDVRVQDLVDNGASYSGRAVRVKGQFELGATMGERTYVLREHFAAQVLIFPVRELQGTFEAEAMKMQGKEVEVTGVFQAARSSGSGGGVPGAVAGYISFWKFDGPPEDLKGDVKAELVDLEALQSRSGRYDGRTIRVYGRFRGKNLYGDLPSRSQRDSRDWILKDDIFAIWITGRKPKGPGFELDINMKRDTEKWMQVVGVPETIKGVVYLRALQVTLGKPEESRGRGQGRGSGGRPQGPRAQPHAPPTPKPPVVVFALPLDGEGEVPTNERFRIQFSRDMNEESFKGRVLIRYAPPCAPATGTSTGRR